MKLLPSQNALAHTVTQAFEPSFCQIRLSIASARSRVSKTGPSIVPGNCAHPPVAGLIESTTDCSVL
jgi:hypothetical protein